MVKSLLIAVFRGGGHDPAEHRCYLAVFLSVGYRSACPSSRPEKQHRDLTSSATVAGAGSRMAASLFGLSPRRVVGRDSWVQMIFVPSCLVAVVTWLLRCINASTMTPSAGIVSSLVAVEFILLCNLQQPNPTAKTHQRPFPLPYPQSPCGDSSPLREGAFPLPQSQLPPSGARNAAGGRAAARPPAGGSAAVHLRGRAL